MGNVRPIPEFLLEDLYSIVVDDIDFMVLRQELAAFFSRAVEDGVSLPWEVIPDVVAPHDLQGGQRRDYESAAHRSGALEVVNRP